MPGAYRGMGQELTDQVSARFGRAPFFLIVNTELLKPPAHEPGVLPKWLHDQGTQVIIAGGMGSRAQQFFTSFGMDVVVGATEATPEEVAAAYLQGKLECGDNVCDH